MSCEHLLTRDVAKCSAPEAGVRLYIKRRSVNEKDYWIRILGVQPAVLVIHHECLDC